eukprot:jgi/Astpho2/3078/Aster-x1117
MHEAMRRRDYGTAARAVLIVLQGMRSADGELATQRRASPGFHEALHAAAEILRHSPQQCKGDQLLRFMRKSSAMQAGPEEAELLNLEVAYLLIEMGDLEQAYDLLDTRPHKKAGKFARAVATTVQLYPRASLRGLIRHGQFLMQEAAQELAQLDAETEFNPFKHDPRITLKAGRRAEEFAKDAQRHLKEALQYKRHSAADTWLLAQIYCLRGKAAEACQLADALVEAAPDSADVQALKLLLCQLPQQRGAPQSQAERLLDLLRVDPGSQEAVSGANLGLNFAVADGSSQSNAAGLMALAEPDTIPPEVLVEGLALHLDVTDCPEDTAFQAWQLLADTLSALAGAVVSLRTKASSESTAQAAAAAAVPSAQVWARWHAVRQLLHEERSWWEQLHFTRPCLVRQAAVLESSSATADEKTLALKEMHSQAVVAAFCCHMENAYVLTALGELQETPGLEAEAASITYEPSITPATESADAIRAT